MKAAIDNSSILPGPMRKLRRILALLASSIDSSSAAFGAVFEGLLGAKADGFALNGLGPGLFPPKPGDACRLA